VLKDSVLECLVELDLSLFAVQLLMESPDITDRLGDRDDPGFYIVFGLNNTDVNQSVSILGHIVNGTAKRREIGVFETLAEDFSLHVRKVEKTKVQY